MEENDKYYLEKREKDKKIKKRGKDKRQKKVITYVFLLEEKKKIKTRYKTSIKMGAMGGNPD